MNIALVLAPLHRDGIDHIASAPRWAPPNDVEGYWHIPRSISADEIGRGRVLFWCGIERDMRLSLLTNREPIGVRCGTCVGRAAGYERRDSTIFQPRSAFDPPRVCPVLVRDGDVCGLCDSKPRHRRSYCHYDEVPHRPGSRFPVDAPCPRHGWKHMGEERRRYYDEHGYAQQRVTGRVLCHPNHWGDENECGYVLFGADAAYRAAWDSAIAAERRRVECARILSRGHHRRSLNDQEAT